MRPKRASVITSYSIHYTKLYEGLLALSANAQDYAREKRWASEVVGNLVVGEPVKLSLKSGHAFLALYAPVPNAHNAVVLVHGLRITSYNVCYTKLLRRKIDDINVIVFDELGELCELADQR